MGFTATQGASETDDGPDLKDITSIVKWQPPGFERVIVANSTAVAYL